MIIKFLCYNFVFGGCFVHKGKKIANTKPQGQVTIFVKDKTFRNVYLISKIMVKLFFVSLSAL